MNLIDEFLYITGYDISVYFTSVNSFIQNKFSSVVRYYKGNGVDKDTFYELNRLIAESDKIQQLFLTHSSNLSQNTLFWDLLDDFEESKSKLKTISNFGKWSRSSYSFGYSSETKYEYILGKNQNVEQISDLLGSRNSQDDWVDISVENSLKEIDYTAEGGNNLFINDSRSNQNFISNGVVDYMIGDRVLGLDIPKKISFENDDLTRLTPAETFEQSAEICLSVSKQSVPEFKNIGFNKSVVGSNLTFILMNSIERDIVNNFKTDDSFRSVTLLSVDTDQDIAKYEFKITSRLEDELIKTF